MNTICIEQNKTLQLERLAAQRSLYSSAKLLFAWHGVLSTLVASTLSVCAQFCTELKPVAVLWGFALAGLDFFWFTPSQKKLRETAAAIQECFDCDVFGLQWQSLKIGQKPDHEMVTQHADVYRCTEPSFKSLRDWYPVSVCELPLFQARLICQRVNAWWDGQQRRRYASALVVCVGALLAALITLGVARGLNVLDLLATVIAPLGPGLWFALRQYRENNDAATRLDKLKDHARELIDRALKGVPEPELTIASRALQDEIFDLRKRNTPVFDWLYRRLRADQEHQMQDGAAQLVRDLQAVRKDGH